MGKEPDYSDLYGEYRELERKYESIEPEKNRRNRKREYTGLKKLVAELRFYKKFILHEEYTIESLTYDSDINKDLRKIVYNYFRSPEKALKIATISLFDWWEFVRKAEKTGCDSGFGDYMIDFYREIREYIQGRIRFDFAFGENR